MIEQTEHSIVYIPKMQLGKVTEYKACFQWVTRSTGNINMHIARHILAFLLLCIFDCVDAHLNVIWMFVIMSYDSWHDNHRYLKNRITVIIYQQELPNVMLHHRAEGKRETCIIC